MIFDLSKDFSYEIKRPLSTKDRNEIAKFWKRFFDLFLKMWKIEAIYKVDKMRKRVDSCLISISILKKGNTRLFHIYCVFLSIIARKEDKLLELKPALSELKEEFGDLAKGKIGLY